MAVAEHHVAASAPLHDLRVAAHDHDSRAARSDERGQAPHVIEVRLRREQHANVLRIESERLIDARIAGAVDSYPPSTTTCPSVVFTRYAPSSVVPT